MMVFVKESRHSDGNHLELVEGYQDEFRIEEEMHQYLTKNKAQFEVLPLIAYPIAHLTPSNLDYL